ncbi:MAG: LysE family translocator [Alphaproteobacteria bacterium]|nr:LysE family translocator [Alphaproteobacteria bacterium]
MSETMLLALTTFCFAASITPGPNNMMLLASGANFGFARTLPHLMGITIGFAVMLLAMGFGVGSLFTAYPMLYTVLRVLSTAYLLWLAWRIATAGGISEGNASGAPMTFLQAAAFQWVNPKAWAFSIGVITAFVAPDNFVVGLLIVSAVAIAVMLPCMATWTGFGTMLKTVLRHEWGLRVFNVTMAVLLVASIYPMMADLAA